jgi:hypothetical protein
MCEEKSLFPYLSVVLASRPLLEQKLPFTLKNGGELRIYQPSKIYIDGSEAKFSSTVVEPRETKVIATIFKTDELDQQKYDTVLLCPSIRFFDATGRPLVAICRGWQTTIIPGVAHGRYFKCQTAQLSLSPLLFHALSTQITEASVSHKAIFIRHQPSLSAAASAYRCLIFSATPPAS